VGGLKKKRVSIKQKEESCFESRELGFSLIKKTYCIRKFVFISFLDGRG